MTDEIRTTLRCPQCGGDNPLPAGERLIRCAFCDSTLFVDRSGLVSHYRLARRLDADAASAALRRWMAGDRTVKDLERKATVVATTAVSFPMWMFRTGPRGSETVLVEPAAPTPIPQVAGIELPAGQLDPYTPETGAETVTATVPLDTARGWLARAGRGEPTETALVHVPFWRFVYRFGAVDYTALVEASTGTVLAGVFPAKAESPYILVAALGLILFGVEGLAFTNVLIKLAAYAVTAVPLAGLAWWVTRRV